MDLFKKKKINLFFTVMFITMTIISILMFVNTWYLFGFLTGVVTVSGFLAYTDILKDNK